MKTAKKNSQILGLIITLVVAVMIVQMGLQAFASGQGYEWLLGKLPFWFVVEALFVMAYFRERSKEDGKRSLNSRFRSYSLTWIYFVPCVAAAMLVKYLLPPQGEAIYSACYWALAGVTLFCLFWFIGSSDRRSAYQRGAKRALAALLVLTGIASGPLFVFWANASDGYSPALAAAAVVLIAPLLLRECGLLSFKPFQMV